MIARRPGPGLARRLVHGALLLSLLLSGRRGQAQAAPAAADAGAQAVEERAPLDSPRGSMARFQELARLGRWVEAARYLELPRGSGEDGPVLARQLGEVLDRHLWLETGRLSAAPQGDDDDGLPPRTDEVGEVPGPNGTPQSVWIVRREQPEGTRWVFARGTVARVPEWYAHLEGRWLRERLPHVLLRRGPRELLWWQWAALPLIALVSWALGRLLGWGSRVVLGRFARRTRTRWDEDFLARIPGPLTMFWACAAASLMVPWLGLYRPAERFVGGVVRAGFLMVLFWSLWRTTDVGADLLGRSPWGKARPGSATLLSLGTRVAKVTVVVLAVITVLSQLGYAVTSLLAGLGIGGLALALSVQKTGENLFGSIAIGVDQPFRVGDYVKVDELQGTVESVGMRSTRIRTLDRTVVTIPNGKLADLRIETYAARDRIRLSCELALVLGTTSAQVRAVVEGLRQVLREHPTIWPDDIEVHLKEIGDWALKIQVMAWFATTDWDEFQRLRQEVLLRFMEVVEAAGTSFAVPARQVRMLSEKG